MGNSEGQSSKKCYPSILPSLLDIVKGLDFFLSLLQFLPLLADPSRKSILMVSAWFDTDRQKASSSEKPIAR